MAGKERRREGGENSGRKSEIEKKRKTYREIKGKEIERVNVRKKDSKKKRKMLKRRDQRYVKCKTK